MKVAATIVALFLSLSAFASAEDEQTAIGQEPVDPVEILGWQEEGVGDMDGEASIVIPEGFRFLEGSDTRKLMNLYGNLPTEIEVGLIAPEDLDWFVVFEFNEIGYVKDDEKDDIDADELLKQMKENDEYSNELRRDAGLPELYTVGWAVEPDYNEEYNSLEWGLVLESSNGEGQSINFLTKKLGRHGVMDVTVVCDPEDLDAVMPQARTLLEGFSFASGKTYAEYEKGDRIAEVGLTALIAGGAAFGAAKLGLFAKLGKLWKVILGGVVVAFVAVRKFFGRVVGVNQQS